MTRDNWGQTRDTRDIKPVPTRDIRDNPPLGGVPVPGGTRIPYKSDEGLIQETRPSDTRGCSDNEGAPS
jgi:hypothetical protein